MSEEILGFAVWHELKRGDRFLLRHERNSDAKCWRPTCACNQSPLVVTDAPYLGFNMPTVPCRIAGDTGADTESVIRPAHEAFFMLLGAPA